MFPLSPKQKEFWNEPFHRYNIKYGATRAGKTYLDYFMIPRRMIERRDNDGLFVFIGNSKGTLQRNVIEPMMNIYGAANVSSMRSDNTCTIFGMKVHCLGADNAAREDKLRGMSIKYCYGDEIVTWNERVFEMLKSRLDKPYSCLDATCNPKDPQHWVKQFIDSGADVFSQQYTIDDNPFLDKTVRENMKKEHSGVFYQRYILGEWCVAEGLVFQYFEPEKDRWVKPFEPEKYRKITIGIDFGETGSLTSMCATGIVGNFERLDVLMEGQRERSDSLDTEMIAQACAGFCAEVYARFKRYDHVFFDQASPALGNRVAAVLRERGLPWRNVAPCVKTPLESRPVTVDGLLCQGRIRINPQAQGIVRALSSLRWDEKEPDIPEDKNIGNINDFWDAFNYSWSAWADYFDRR